MTMESKQGREMSEQVVEKNVTKTATCTLTVREQRVEIDSTAGDMTITMPPVAEAAGKIFALYVKTFSGAITIAAGDSQDFTAPTFNGVDDGELLYSDGIRWWPLSLRT